MTARRVFFVLLVASLIATACGLTPSATIVPTEESTATQVPARTIRPTETSTPEPACQGNHIAYVQQSLEGEAIWVMCEDGTGRRQLVADPGVWSYYDLQWSLDGRRIFFQSQSEEGMRFEVVNADGTGRSALSRYYTYSPDDSYISVAAILLPDGEHIIYTHPEGGIYLANPDGEEERLLVEGAFGGIVSPDGARLLFSRWDPPYEGLTAFYVVNMDGTGERQLSEGMQTFFSEAFWSPDGQMIAFVALESGEPDLYVMSTDGRGVRRLTYGLGVDPYHLSWSWNSQAVAFTSGMNRPVIYLVGAEGVSDPKFLAQGRMPVWSPSDRTIVYQAWNTELNSWTLYSIEAWYESDPVLLIDVSHENAWEPAWSPVTNN